MLFHGAPRTTQRAVTFQGSEGYIDWLRLVLSFVFLAFLVLPFVWSQLRDVRQQYARASRRLDLASGVRGYWAGLVLLICVAGIVQYVFGRRVPLDGWQWRSAIHVSASVAVLGPAIVGIWLTAPTLRRLRAAVPKCPAIDSDSCQPAAWRPVHRDIIDQLQTLPRTQQRLLVIASTAVSIVTLTTGALRSAVMAADAAVVWSPAGPLIFGAQWAAILALSFAPSALHLQNLRHELVASITPLPAAQPRPQWFELRDNVSNIVGIERRARHGLTAVLAIAAPILTSLAGVLLPGT